MQIKPVNNQLSAGLQPRFPNRESYFGVVATRRNVQGSFLCLPGAPLPLVAES